MDPWDYKPAEDLNLTTGPRSRSLKREPGLASAVAHAGWLASVKVYLKVYHRLKVHGREHLPAATPFVLIANHTSHLDAMTLAAVLRAALWDRVFPVAAGDVFFDSAAKSFLSATLINALPMWRKSCGPHALDDLKTRLVSGSCGLILFPEGTRSRDGSPNPFKAGLGMIVAGTAVPVVPCHIRGAFEAWRPGRRWPSPKRVEVRVGPPLLFDGVKKGRDGWDHVARECEAAVRALSGVPVPPPDSVDPA